MQKKQKKTIILACIFIVVALIAVDVQSQPIVYPAKGQSEAQQSKDKGECHQWAVKNTGVDPAQIVADTNSGEAYQRQHSAISGGARGALGGLVIGAIAGDAGKGAAIGAGSGAVIGGLRGRGDLEKQQQAVNHTHAVQQEQLQKFDRGYTACLTGRGYTIK